MSSSTVLRACSSTSDGSKCRTFSRCSPGGRWRTRLPLSPVKSWEMSLPATRVLSADSALSWLTVASPAGSVSFTADSRFYTSLKEAAAFLVCLKVLLWGVPMHNTPLHASAYPRGNLKTTLVPNPLRWLRAKVTLFQKSHDCLHSFFGKRLDLFVQILGDSFFFQHFSLELGNFYRTLYERQDPQHPYPHCRLRRLQSFRSFVCCTCEATFAGIRQGGEFTLCQS